MAAPSSLGNQASRVPLVSQGSTLIRDEPFFVARARSKAMRARAFFGLDRWEWGGGTRRKPIPGGSWAPCSFVQSCTNGKTGVGRPAQPVRRMRRTHGAQRSRHPTPTSPRHIAVLTETSGATARCFHVRSWLKLLCGQGLLRWAACVRRAGQRYRQSFGNRPYLVSIACAWPACFACPWLPINCRGGAGWVGGTLHRMDAVAEPYLIGIWQFRCREPAWAAV